MDEDDTIALCGAEPMKNHTKRRKRRRAKLRLNHGAVAVRAHKRKTGRTGQIKEKRNHGKGEKFAHRHPNPPWQVRVDLPKR